MDDAILVTDPMLLSGVRSLLTDVHMLAEPSAAAGLAGAWRLRSQLKGKRVVIAVTDANISVAHLPRALDGPPLCEEGAYDFPLEKGAVT